MKTNDPTTEESKEHPPVPALPDTDITEEETTSDAKGKPVPNSKPRPAPVNTDDTYVYKDYAQTPLESLDTSTCHKKVPPQCLQAQKLPSKLAVMLTDPGELNITFSCFLITYFIISIFITLLTYTSVFTQRSRARGQLASPRKKLEDRQS